MSRKQYRTGEDGEPIALASACVVCQSPKVYALDRCHAHYMSEYRRLRRTTVVASHADAGDKAPNAAATRAGVQSPKGDKAPDTTKPWQRAETFEKENFAVYWLQ